MGFHESKMKFYNLVITKGKLVSKLNITIVMLYVKRECKEVKEFTTNFT